MIIELEPLDAVVAEWLTAGHGKPCGTTAPDPISHPYSHLRSMTPGAPYESAFGGKFRIFTVAYQVDSIGLSEAQAKWMADRNREIWLDPEQFPLVIEGLEVMSRDHEGGPYTPQTVQGADIWSVAERYSLTVDTLN